MYKYLPHSVVVLPLALLNYFKSVVCRPPFDSLELLEIHDVWSEGDMCYVDFFGSEEDYYELDSLLTGASIPYNFYPKALDELVTFVRLIDDGAEECSKSVPYATFLAHKHMDIPNRGEHTDSMIELEHNWENQVEFCLTQSVLNLLEE